MSAEKRELDSISGLSRRLDIERDTLLGYLKQPDAPQMVEERKNAKLYDVEEVTAYVQVNAKSDRTAVKTDESLIELKRRRLKIQCEREQIALEAARGKYYPKDQVLSEDAQIHQTVKAVLMRKLVNELPPKLFSLPVDAITEKMRDTVLEICRQFRSRGTWESPPKE